VLVFHLLDWVQEMGLGQLVLEQGARAVQGELQQLPPRVLEGREVLVEVQEMQREEEQGEAVPPKVRLRRMGEQRVVRPQSMQEQIPLEPVVWGAVRGKEREGELKELAHRQVLHQRKVAEVQSRPQSVLLREWKEWEVCPRWAQEALPREQWVPLRLPQEQEVEEGWTRPRLELVREWKKWEVGPKWVQEAVPREQWVPLRLPQEQAVEKGQSCPQSVPVRQWEEREQVWQ
jgi:hypothetical protein